MTRDSLLNIINDLIAPKTKISESTIISACDDIDSLSLLTTYLELKKLGFDCDITEYLQCVRVGDIISMALKSGQ